MTRFKKIKSLSVKEMAELIEKKNLSSEFCKSDCFNVLVGLDGCPHPVECCINWLKEEWKEGGGLC